MTRLWDAPEPAAAPTYVERARALAPLIESVADQTEQERCLPAPVVSALHGAGLYRLLLPRGLGGAEVDPVTFVRVIEEIAKADASTAWCLCQASGCSMSAAYLAPGVAKQIFGDDPRAVLAWGPGPDARATAVDGGYRLSGTWSFASGCRQANWLGGHAPIVEPDGKTRRRPDGSVDARTMLLPASSATIIDVWNVSGLRGTASDAFTVSDLFVPHERAIVRDDPAERQVPGALYCFPPGEPLRLRLRGPRPRHRRRVARRPGGPRGGEDGARRQEPAARQRSDPGAGRPRGGAAPLRARAVLLGSLADIWAAVGRSGVLTLDQRMLIRLAATYAIHEAKEVVDAAASRRRGVRHLHGQRVRPTLPRHARGDPAAPGTPGALRDGGPVRPRPLARHDLPVASVSFAVTLPRRAMLERAMLDDLILALQRLIDRLVRRLRLGPAPAPTRPRLLVVQIDGLSRVALERRARLRPRAVPRAPAQAPRLPAASPCRWACPPRRPAFQMAAMYGVRPDIPGFHYYDREWPGDIHFPRAGARGARRGAPQPPAAAGSCTAAARTAASSPGARRTTSSASPRSCDPPAAASLCALSPVIVVAWVIAKSVVLTVVELVRALLRFVADPVQGRHGWRWLTIKIGLSVWVRGCSRSPSPATSMRGRPRCT